MRLKKVISGGQTGMDQLGLRKAREAGIPTGGTAPLLYMTEDGPNPSLREEYGLKEHTARGYPPRTWQNVIDSDATVLFGDVESAGSKETIKYCKKANKPYIVNPTSAKLLCFLLEHRIGVLNVAGNRGSKCTPESLGRASISLGAAFKVINLGEQPID